MGEVCITLIAGLGLVLAGSRLLVDGLKRAIGPRLAGFITAALRRPGSAIAAGVVAGAALQSTNAVGFIAASLVGAGAASLAAVLPLMSAAYIGSASRLFLIALDGEGLTLLVLGGVGLCFARSLDRSQRCGPWVYAALGLGLILLGSETIVRGAAPLNTDPTVARVLFLVKDYALLGFAASIVIGTLAQGMTVSVIVIALAQAGTLDLPTAAVLVVGANLGSGLLSALQASALEGIERQVSRYQLLCKITAATVVLPMLWIERYTGLPLLCGALEAWIHVPALQVTMVHLALQLVPIIVLLPANGFIAQRLVGDGTLKQTAQTPRVLGWVRPRSLLGKVSRRIVAVVVLLLLSGPSATVPVALAS